MQMKYCDKLDLLFLWLHRKAFQENELIATIEMALNKYKKMKDLKERDMLRTWS